MAETIEGVVQNANAQNGGVVLQGTEGWFNRSKYEPQPPVPVVGQRVRLTYTTTAQGGRYYNEVEVLGNGASPAGGSPATARNDSIEWQVCVKAAVECLKANLDYTARTHPDEGPRPILPDAVVMYAQALYDGRPGAEPPEPQDEGQ